MIAFHVQRGLAVPMVAKRGSCGSGFLNAMAFPFAAPVVEYDRKRTTVSELKQLELFVTDESSAIR
jgi:hypothetical protein